MTNSTNQQNTAPLLESGVVYRDGDPTPVRYRWEQTGVTLVLLTDCCHSLASMVNNGMYNLAYCRCCGSEMGMNYATRWHGIDDLLAAGYVTDQPAPLQPRALAPMNDDDEELL